MHNKSPGLYWPSFEHAQRRTIILPNDRVLFVPMPKGGCTSILWLLAELAGYQHDHFEYSMTPQISAAMTVHDITLWNKQFRWAESSDKSQASITNDDGWLRFTTIRHPASRLWSAWQSKLLMREPAYTMRFDDAPWFPRVPRHPMDVVHAFRTFVQALGESGSRKPIDVHWAPQTKILESAPPLNFVGHVESFPDTLAKLNEHIGTKLSPQDGLARENTGMLPFSPAVFDDQTTDIVNSIYADDYDAYNYTPLQPTARTDLSSWVTEARPLIPAIGELIERHQRIGVLQRAVAGGSPYVNASCTQAIRPHSDAPQLPTP